MNEHNVPMKMKPVWFFVGLILLIMGGIILLSGVYGLVRGFRYATVLSHLRPDIWWGAIMAAAGANLFFRNR